jgi:uncharacterized protein YndB with AHSA1/START domain
VWRALTDIREFAQWFSVECTAGQFAPGERVDMVCTTPGYEGVKFYVIVDEMTPERRFAWRWHPGVEKPGEDFSSEAMTQVVFELEDEASGALIRVVESGFDLLPPERREKAHKENDGGWEFMLSALVQYL